MKKIQSSDGVYTMQIDHHANIVITDTAGNKTTFARRDVQRLVENAKTYGRLLPEAGWRSHWV